MPRRGDQSGAVGILIGGEELHNNHHTYPNSAKLSVKKWEFDLGWAWIKVFSFFRLAKVQRVAPIAHRVEGKGHLDMDTAMAILNNRFQIMAQYRKLVIGPLVKQELDKVDHSVRHQFHRAKRLLSRETSLLEDRHHLRIQNMLEHSQALKVIYENAWPCSRSGSRPAPMATTCSPPSRNGCTRPRPAASSPCVSSPTS